MTDGTPAAAPLDAGGDRPMFALERGAGRDTIEHRFPAAVAAAGPT